ncbi:MAG: PAS domain-containing protein [Puniceicoccaceae bacterium]
MSFDIKSFQKRYGLSNKEVASVCDCSLPTIQKWRSGEVAVSGAAAQLMTLLDIKSEGDSKKFRDILGQMKQPIEPSRPEQDPAIDQLESSMTKVVDRLELMLESRRKDRDIAQSEARYRSIVECFTTPVCRWEPDTTLTYANEAYRKLFSRFGDDLIGKKWLEFVPADKRASLLAIVSDMVRRAEPETLVERIDLEDGTSRYLEWLECPVKNDRGELVEYHTVAHDVTELMDLRRERNELSAVREALEGMCDKPVLTFDSTGKFLRYNHLFESSIMAHAGWKDLASMMPGQATGRLKRLMRRLGNGEEICYQMKVGARQILLRGQVISRHEGDSHYLAVFEEIGKEEASQVLSVRLMHEVILDGQPHDFLMEKDAETRVLQQMEDLGKAVQVDRIYVFTLDHEEGLFDNVLEWCAEGIVPQIHELKRLPMSEYPWWIERIRNNHWIQIEDTSKMSRGAFRERDILEAQGIRALLVAPVVVEGVSIGFVGFDHNRAPRIWHAQEQAQLTEFKESIEKVLKDSVK